MKTNDGWCLLGIASWSENDVTLRQILNNPVSLYTFVFILLIDYVSSTTVNTFGSIISNTDLYCKLRLSYSEDYTCEIFRIKNVNRITSVGGSNVNGKSYSDVNIFESHKIEVKSLPNAIGEIFPKLQKIEIIHASLRNISRLNFKSMKNLTVLRLSYNKLASLSQETFWDLENVKELSMSHNLLKELPEKLLMSMVSLRTFNAEQNVITFLARDLFANNLKIEYIELSENPLKTIYIKFSIFEYLWGVFFSSQSCIEDDFFVYNETNETRLMKLNEFDQRIQEKCQMKEDRNQNIE